MESTEFGESRSLWNQWNLWSPRQGPRARKQASTSSGRCHLPKVCHRERTWHAESDGGEDPEHTSGVT